MNSKEPETARQSSFPPSIPSVQKNHIPGMGPQPYIEDNHDAPVNTLYAALDLGTNNCRLLITCPSPKGFRVIDSYSRLVRLGEGLESTGKLSDEAIERTIEALRICKLKLDASNVKRARLAATEACRSATNGDAFIKRVKAEIDLDLEILDGKTEAYLAVTGCANLVDPTSESAVIFDIGGGSTEIAWLEGATAATTSVDPCKRIKAWDSLSVGVVTLAERFGGKDITPEIFENMVKTVEKKVKNFATLAKQAINHHHFHLLGTSGTVTTIAGVFLGLPRYDRRKVDGLWMSRDDMHHVIHHLLNNTFEQRAAHPCIGEERADLVMAGCAILEAISRAFPTNHIRIADRGLREGMLMSLMREDGVWQEN